MKHGLGLTGTILAAGAVFTACGGVTLEKVGEYDFGVDGCGGITYAGGNRFYVLQDHDTTDNKARVYPLTLSYNGTTGAITGQTLGTAFTPGSNGDSEGIAYDPGSGCFWISDEATPSIKEFYDYGMPTARNVPVPAVQKKKRDNRSLEALTVSGDGLTLWTANEQALQCDGESSDGTTSVRTVVRLTRFTRPTVDDDWTAAGEWPYACDPCQGSTYAQSGLSGLCALPDGSLLTLEREISAGSILGGTWGRCRVYRLESTAFTAANDVSAIPALTNASYTAVSKGSSLVSFTASSMEQMIVYEGICLGPRLSDGSLAVYLVSDGGATKSLYGFTAITVSRLCALKLKGMDVSTVDFGTPAAGYTVSRHGSNYRYLTGTELFVTLDGPGLAPQAYTNNGTLCASATWSTGGGSTSGTTATITVAKDTSLAWNVTTTTAVTPIVGNDSFEDVPVGTALDALSGWTGGGSVTAASYQPATPPGYPMQRTTHTQVLSVDDEAERTYSSKSGVRQNLDTMVRVVLPQDETQVDPSDVQAGVTIGMDGRFRVHYLADDGVTFTNALASSRVFKDGDWVRLSMAIDYTVAAPTFTLRLDGESCGTYRCAGAKDRLRSLCVQGQTAVDDVIFTDGDPDFEVCDDPSTTERAPIKVPQTWFDRYGISWNPLADDDGDGLSSWKEYLAGTSPVDEESVFAISEFKVEEGPTAVIRFTGKLPCPEYLSVRWWAELGGTEQSEAGTVEDDGETSVWRAKVPAEAHFFRAKILTP